MHPRRRKGILAAALLSCATPGMASAHPEWSPIRVNRYLKLALDQASPRIVYTVLYGEAPALPLRKSVDTNADGRVDAAEKAQLGARVAASVRQGLKISIDGAPITLPSSTVDVGLAGESVAAEPLSVDLTFELTVPTPSRIVFDDRVEVPNEGDTELSIDAPVPSRLVGAYRGPPTTDPPQVDSKLFTFRGPRFSALEDRTVTVELAAQSRASSLGGLLRMLVAPMGALLLLAALVLAVRSRARSDA